MLTLFPASRLPACQCIRADPQCSELPLWHCYTKLICAGHVCSGDKALTASCSLVQCITSAACCRRELESSSSSTTGLASRRLEELSSAAESAKEQLNKTQRQLDAVRAELRTKTLEVYVLSDMWSACFDNLHQAENHLTAACACLRVSACMGLQLTGAFQPLQCRCWL